MDMGERIKKLRTDRGMTQEELGKILGVKKAAIQKYESGSVENLKRSSIKILATTFGVSPSYLMGFDEEENKLPSLTAKDELEVAKALENILSDYDSQHSLAAYNETDDEEDRELLRASLENTMRLAKQIAKKKFTPNKYRKD